MASPYTETSTASLFQEFGKAEAEIDSYFNWLKQLVEERKLALQKKLREKRSELEELVKSWKGQMEEIELMKQQLVNIGVKFNQTNALREETLKGLDSNLENLKKSIKIPKISFLGLDEKLKEAIESVDLMFVENDYKDLVLPIKSIELDSILSSMKVAAVSEDDKGKNKLGLRLGNMALNTQSGHFFVLNKKSENILVFDQDGNFITCLNEKFYDLSDLSIDLKNNYLFVLDGDTLFKFNLETSKLLKKKKFELKDDNLMICLDTFIGEVYVGSSESISHFSSGFKLVQSFHAFTNIYKLYCHEKGIFFQSLNPEGLNVCSYRGELIRKIPLPFNIDGMNNPILEQLEIYPYSMCVDKYGFILIANTFAHCITVLNCEGDLVHTIKLESEEGRETVFPTGIAVTDDNKIILSVVRSRFPLRIF